MAALTTLARSMPDIDGAPRAAATASARWASVTSVPTGKPRMQPFCAPAVRRRRVSARVSMPQIATVPSRRR